MVVVRKRTSRAVQWEEHRAYWKSCTACSLSQHRKVFGRGILLPEFAFIGIGPGASETAIGEAFVGRAGRCLSSALQEIRLREERQFFGNIVACRPCEVEDGRQRNRDPEPQEEEACRGRFIEMLRIVRPKYGYIICGDYAWNVITESPSLIGAGGLILELKKPAMKCWHPSYVMRAGGPGGSLWARYLDQLAGAVERIRGAD